MTALAEFTTYSGRTRREFVRDLGQVREKAIVYGNHKATKSAEFSPPDAGRLFRFLPSPTLVYSDEIGH